MPNGAEPAGVAVGDDDSSVRLEPFTENALIACAPLSTTQRVCPSGASRASYAPLGEPSDVVLASVSDPSDAIV